MSSQPVQSQLLKLRSLTVPQNYPSIVHRIFDKKLRSFLSLDSKQLVLQNCQELLITKTIDYMNCINDQEKNQLKTLNAINAVLIDKQNYIQELKVQITKLNIEIKEQTVIIGNLNNELVSNKKAFVCDKERLMTEIADYAGVVREQERGINVMKSEFMASKSNLEALNKELSYDLGVKTTEVKKLLAAHKEEMTASRVQKEKDSMEAQRKYRQKVAEFEEMKQELTKDKKYLQDLIEVKDDEIKEAKKPRVRNFVSQSQFSFFVKQKDLEKEKQELKQKEKQKERLKQKQKQKQKQIEREKRSKDPSGMRSRSKTKQSRRESFQQDSANVKVPTPVITEPLLDIIKQKPKESKAAVKTNDMSVQCSIESKKQEQNKSLKIDTYSQTCVQNPQDQRDLNQFQIKIKDYMQEKYKALYEQKAKYFAEKIKQQYIQALKEARCLTISLKQLTNERIQWVNFNMNQVQQIYWQRPSRQQDLQYIKHLLKQNQSLAELCFEANKKTDSAYVALQEYHTRLESYKKAIPVNVSGYIPPKIHHSQGKMMKQSKLSFKRFNTATSTYNNEKKLRIQDLDSFTKEVLMTEYESEYVMTPIRKTRRSRAETTGTGYRRKSMVN